MRRDFKKNQKQGKSKAGRTLARHPGTRPVTLILSQPGESPLALILSSARRARVEGQGRRGASPLNLVVEIKGFQNENAKLKKETAEEKWVPGVNALKTGGRWAFAQFESVFEIEHEFGEFISRFTTGGEKGEAA